MRLLFRPEYMRGGLQDGELLTALKQVCALGPSGLARAVRKAPSSDVRCAAVKRLRDMELLARTAHGDLDQFVRITAVRRLDELSKETGIPAADDNASLANAAFFDRVCEILGRFGSFIKASWRFFKKLKNPDMEKYCIPVQMLFAEIARDDPDGSVRMEAVKRLNDTHTLSVIAKSDPEEFVRQAARRRIGGFTEN